MTTELLNTLYVQTQGADLRLDEDTVRVRLPDAPGRRTLPLRRLDGIVLYGHVNLSTELITRCAQDARPITWMSRSGRYLARLDGAVRGNVLLRHAQHQLHDDHDTRVGIARNMVAGKIRNSRWILLRAARDAAPGPRAQIRAAAADLADALAATAAADGIDTLMGIEGAAARAYFSALQHVFRPAEGIPAFLHRNRRPPTDPVNALLSFAYGLLRGLVHGAAEQVGLDPYIGYLHGLRPGKPALSLDLMEEFRPVLADRFALTLLNRRQLRPEHFEHLAGGAVRLTEDGRKTVISAWQEWKLQTWEHPLAGRDVPAGLLPVVQARLLSRHLRGELPGYLPWTAA
ncbi:type I-C CRISPR-associated endonuclease Cas1c [Streptomyces sp. TRM 70351]|uniref:type I-C CRISPR-associated endonuclease Cas1c n=1 Tax=Streptomyces sp. TRM 70351 TaxID=3116552 RepID=UPI002E7BE2AE|nr:type I-C CRISPR-associated endonuclease Cas1c [Streptomyces sp. TRM 70351]MEE1928314.1 type I-C CRISPR-associated endonuclease Cas1c [Streptomyces sp. TRM 70351]